MNSREDEDRKLKGLPSRANAPVPLEPTPAPAKLGLVSVIGSLISLGLTVWNWIKMRRRDSHVDSGDQKVQSNQGQESDYAGLDDIENGVYDLGGARRGPRIERVRHHAADRGVLREPTRPGAEPLQRAGEGSDERGAGDRPEDETPED